MRMVDAGEAPQLLEGYKAYAKGRRPAKHTPPIAMSMDDQLGVSAKSLHGREANGVHAYHKARSASFGQMVMTSEHLIEITGEISRIHDETAGTVGNFVQDSQHSRSAVFEETAWTV